MISIITPIKDTPRRYFEDCILSVLKLSTIARYKVEWVIIIDDDTRNIEDWIGAHITDNDSLNLKVIRLPSHVGLGMARNIGVANAIHPYVTWLDADDLYDPIEAEEFLFEATHTLHHRKDIILAYSNNAETDEDLNTLHIRDKKTFNKLHLFHRGTSLDPIYYVDFVYQCQVIRKTDFALANGFDAKKIGEDVDLILKLATQHPHKTFTLIPRVAYLYRRNPNGIVHTRYSELRKINLDAYNKYASKVGVNPESREFRVMFLDIKNETLTSNPNDGVFYNTFLPSNTPETYRWKS